MSVQGVASAGQGSPTWPLWLGAWVGYPGPRERWVLPPTRSLAGCSHTWTTIPSQYLSLASQLRASKDCSVKRCPGGSAVLVRHSGFHLWPESWSPVTTHFSSQFSQVTKAQGRVLRLGGRTLRDSLSIPKSPFPFLDNWEVE